MRGTTVDLVTLYLTPLVRRKLCTNVGLASTTNPITSQQTRFFLSLFLSFLITPARCLLQRRVPQTIYVIQLLTLVARAIMLEIIWYVLLVSAVRIAFGK